MGKIKLVLFDLDGVLVDATNLHYRAFNAALYAITGLLISDQEHENRFNGLPTKNKLDILLSENRIKKENFDDICSLKQIITIELINNLIVLDPDKIKLMQELEKLEICIGCVTNCSLQTTEMMLDKSHIFDFIDLMVTNGDVTKPKPDPEGYLRAIRYFNIDNPDKVLIVEDSPKGLEAAKLTGANVLAVSGPNEVTWENIQKYL